MQNFLLGRQGLYEYLFASHYTVPEAHFIESIHSFNELMQALRQDPSLVEAAKGKNFLSMSSVRRKLDEGCDILDKYINEIESQDSATILAGLNRGFTGLFVGPKAVKQRESEYRDVSKEEIVLSVSDFFAEYDMQKPTHINDPIDSFSMQLFCMYNLANILATNNTIVMSGADNAQEASALSLKTLNSSIIFLQQHLLLWKDDFVKTVISANDDRGYVTYYTAVAILCGAFIDLDYNNLISLVAN